MSRQFGPSDLQNRYIPSLPSPHCVIVLCSACLLLIFDPIERYKPCLSGNVSTRVTSICQSGNRLFSYALLFTLTVMN